MRKIYKKNSNGQEEDFEEIKDFRGLNKLDKCSIDGFVIIHLYKCKYSKEQSQEIHINVGTREDDREEVMTAFRKKLADMRR